MESYVIRLEGEFDLSERHRLADAFAVPSSAPIVVLDLSRATYVDSIFLKHLIVLDTATRLRRARLFVVGPSPALRRLFAICKLDESFVVRNSLDEVDGVDPARLRRLTLIARS
jgi:anti-anti-sigma factor